ncbi:MAG: YggS family pyridoxal phosphate-dependent enzyme [Peptococcaceae bacterium]|jgi:pyridoxal phosphate enzyme (YggS family)|nr:YggS family pyridoxal phosphate-dependent enzyme [Peptococcaceae bacterium]MBQ2034666.1 YggS family pyridoxal phosphate-dependent enzyme [Peptococcaceae bacterium]MBQ2120375.1 YggS family pyridoxal phosphate-dependent enzyme [Peptococcaceae bacterium]MBQ2448881.1 YggS family pyridoxal phosphate-dependent enzyme [Peptococcaceae bacterium]MBQ5652084.1 YggS family pyridoxal phosphate-dependent enzyme [Peptococcaceae bacterium]
MSIAENIAEIRKNMEEARKKSPNPEQPVTLVAVTKTRTPEQLNEVLAAGQNILGENRVQELMDKYDAVNPGADWHIIGHLQSNKVKYIADKVVLVHSLESESLAKELNRRMLEIGHPMDCLVQVNIADEESKFGLAKEEVVPFLEMVSNMPGIHVKGLMNIAPFFEDTEQVRPIFREMYQLFQELKEKQIPGIDMEILSMGMSHDYQVAIEEGANMIRVGRSMFA